MTNEPDQWAELERAVTDNIAAYGAHSMLSIRNVDALALIAQARGNSAGAVLPDPRGKADLQALPINGQNAEDSEEALRRRMDNARTEMQEMVSEDLKPGGLFDQVFRRDERISAVADNTPSADEIEELAVHNDECEPTPAPTVLTDDERETVARLREERNAKTVRGYDALLLIRIIDRISAPSQGVKLPSRDDAVIAEILKRHQDDGIASWPTKTLQDLHDDRGVLLNLLTANGAV